VEIGLLEPLVAMVEISTEQGPRSVGVDSLMAGMRRSQRSGRQETGKDGLEFHLSGGGNRREDQCAISVKERNLFARQTDTTKQKQPVKNWKGDGGLKGEGI